MIFYFKPDMRLNKNFLFSYLQKNESLTIKIKQNTKITQDIYKKGPVVHIDRLKEARIFKNAQGCPK